MIQILIQLFVQTVFIMLRTVQVLHIVDNDKKKTIFTGQLIQLVHLFSVGFAVYHFHKILGGEVDVLIHWLVLIAYFIGGALGNYLGLKIKNSKYYGS